jgi:mannose-6-phosphate isomerase-like protein (cupin superfamily)
VAVAGNVYTILVSGKQSAGRYALIDMFVPPGGGPPPHVHHREEETFYVLEGEFEFFRHDQPPVRAAVGDYVRTPQGVVHTFRNVGATPGRLLTLAAPAGIERFFAAVGRPVAPGGTPRPEAEPPTPEQIEHVVRTAQQYGIEILAPPPAGR